MIGNWLKYSLTILMIGSLAGTFYGQNAALVDDQLLTQYIALNDAEDRYLAYKDDERMLGLKLIQLALINKSRKRFKAAPVELDILASRVANKMCQDAVEGDYFSHWNHLGQKPYHRYAAAGGLDHVSENAAKIDDPRGFELSDEVYLANMKRSHGDFMAERAPKDGHKKNVINKAHNFVGLGVYMKDGRFRYYEEFIDRYYTFHQVPSQVKSGENFEVVVELQPGQFLFQSAVFYEKIKPRKPKFGSYADFSDKLVKQYFPWELAQLRSGSTYTIGFEFDQPGLYYIHLYQHDQEIVKPQNINSKGKLQASGIVVEVLP